MFHTMSLAEIDEQHVELLPTRTLMSLMTQGSKSTPGSHGESSNGDSGLAGLLKGLGPLANLFGGGK